VIGAAMIKDEARCIRCGLCALRCPVGEISMEAFHFKSAEPTGLIPIQAFDLRSAK
jgi:Fe-S-cluster-containing hydrogenase component 2